jgi:hypothetical protein
MGHYVVNVKPRLGHKRRDIAAGQVGARHRGYALAVGAAFGQRLV